MKLKKIQSWRFIQRLTILLTLILGLALVLPIQAQNDEEVLVLSVKGPVMPAMSQYFDRGVSLAQDRDMHAVVIVLDTPGGMVDTTINIVQLFQRAQIPIIVFVGPEGAQAASAGSIITMAGHASGMAPQTVIGAASPVGAEGQDLGETIQRKVIEDLKAIARGLTERRGEEAVALAEAMIEEARAVNSREALDAGLIDVIAADVPDLLNQLDGLTVDVRGDPVTLRTAGARETNLPTNFIESLMFILANPTLIGILMFIGVQGILIELSNPGSWIPGIVGITCLALAFLGLGMLPINYLGLGLIAIAFALFVAEVVTPTFGALAIGGTISLVIGLLVLFNTADAPEFARISVWEAIAISLLTASFFIFILTKALTAHRKPTLTGRESLVGRVGAARRAFKKERPEALHYTGSVLVAGELWRAVSDEEIDDGEDVVVKAVDGFTIRVTKA